MKSRSKSTKVSTSNPNCPSKYPSINSQPIPSLLSLPPFLPRACFPSFPPLPFSFSPLPFYNSTNSPSALQYFFSPLCPFPYYPSKPSTPNDSYLTTLKSTSLTHSLTHLTWSTHTTCTSYTKRAVPSHQHYVLYL